MLMHFISSNSKTNAMGKACMCEVICSLYYVNTFLFSLWEKVVVVQILMLFTFNTEIQGNNNA